MQTVTPQTNTTIPLSMIDPLPTGNSRKKRNPVKFNELIASVKERGVIQPVLVRPAGDRFELVAGYGRWEASQLAGVKDIPAHIRVLTDAEAQECQIDENLNREDMSLLDECTSVQTLATFYKGDRQAVADRMCWTLKKVNERLEVMRCCDDVLAALDSGEINVGHALLLAPFNEKTQKATLHKIKTEKWTVQFLKQRANKAQLPLAMAKFDTAECNGCQHNSAAQSGLFGLDEQKAACSNGSCFKEKSAAWLNTRKAELAEQYGTVLLLQEVNEEDRNTVAASNVGYEQYQSGCMGCEKRVALLDDRIGRSFALTIENQCIEPNCFVKNVKAQAAANEAVAEEATPDANDTKSSATTTTTAAKAEKPKKEVKKVTPTKVTDDYKAQLRQSCAEHVKNDENVRLAFQLASLLRTSDGYNAENCKEAGFGNRLGVSFDDVVLRVSKLPAETLKGEIANVVTHMMFKNPDNQINFTALMIKLLKQQDESTNVAIAGWTPTKERLEKYTTNGLSALCVEAGFDKAMNGLKAGEFAKAMKKSKGDIIKVILAFEFDWSNFAPSEYLAMIK